MPRAACRAGHCSGIRDRVPIVAVLLLAGACSRSTPNPGAVRGDKTATPSPSSALTTPAAEHLARGEDARERSDFSRARDELEKAVALFEQAGDWEGYVRARNS